MGLYDREHAQKRPEVSYGAAEEQTRRSALSAFIKQTYQLFAASLLAASAGAYIGMGFAHVFMENRMLYWGIVIVEFILLFGLFAAKKKQGLNLILLFAFTFATGLTLTPLLSVILNMPGGAGIVTNAFILTTVAFGGLSVFAMNAKKDFSAMGKILFISLIVIIVASIINIFTQSSGFQLLIAGGASILFSAFILYDTQNIIKGRVETPVEGAISLYLNFLNLFISLLQIFGILGRDD